MEEEDIAILKEAKEMFMRFGVKSVTMDDISKAVGISKKTLYQCVANKSDLISKAIQLHVQEEQAALSTFKEEAKNAIEEVILISRHVRQIIQSVHPSVIFDLQKYYRQQWALINALQQEFIYGVIKENLKRGIAEKLYREDMNIDIVSRLYGAKAHSIVDEEVFSSKKYDHLTVHREFVRYHLHAITSEKGHTVLEEYYRDMD